jgi:hypothetical protein
MTLLTRDAILSAEDLKSERVEVPEWGGEVIVRCMTGEERDEFETSVLNGSGDEIKVDPSNLRAKLVSLSCIDEDGKRLFTAKDVAKLGNKSAGALDRVAQVAQRLSRVSDADVEDLGKD